MLHIPHPLPLHPEACFGKVLTQQGKDSPPRWLPLLAGAGSWISEFYLATTLRFEFFLSCDSGSSLITRKKWWQYFIRSIFAETTHVEIHTQHAHGPKFDFWSWMSHWASLAVLFLVLHGDGGAKSPNHQASRREYCQEWPGTPEHKKRKTWLIQS